MFAWFKAIEPAYQETLKWQVDVPSDATVDGGILRTGVQGPKAITEVVYPVRWFLAQQALVRELLKAQPDWMATGEERLTWALFLMAAVGEGLLAINASDLLWGRAFYGVPPWIEKALNPKWTRGERRIPADLAASPSMQRLYTGYAKVLDARAKLNLKVPEVWGVPFGGSTYADGLVPHCAAADVARMKASGYWQSAWDKKRPRTRESSVGPILTGCGTMNVAPFLTLPLINDVYDRPRWWLYGNMRLQPLHIPWSKGTTFKALYNQGLGIVARGYETAVGGRVLWASKFMQDAVATAWRDAQYDKALGTGGVAKTITDDFDRIMASKWSFLAFRYQTDALGDSSVLGTPFDPDSKGSFRVPQGFRFIPTLPELVRDTATSPAFNVALLSGEYAFWGAWFVAIDYPELVSAFQKDWAAFIANGQRPVDYQQNSAKYLQAYLSHDDMRKIRKADNKARLLGVFGPIAAEIGAIIDAYYGNYASAIGNMKAAIQGAKKQIDAVGDLTASDVFVEMPDDVFLRSAAVPTDPDGDPLKQPKDMVFLSDTHGGTATVTGRYVRAFQNSIVLIKAAMPLVVPKIVDVLPAATLSQWRTEQAPGVSKKKALLSDSQTAKRTGVWALAVVAVGGSAWWFRKRVLR